jgi:hypothetical protein
VVVADPPLREEEVVEAEAEEDDLRDLLLFRMRCARERTPRTTTPLSTTSNQNPSNPS